MFISYFFDYYLFRFNSFFIFFNPRLSSFYSLLFFVIFYLLKFLPLFYKIIPCSSIMYLVFEYLELTYKMIIDSWIFELSCPQSFIEAMNINPQKHNTRTSLTHTQSSTLIQVLASFPLEYQVKPFYVLQLVFKQLWIEFLYLYSCIFRNYIQNYTQNLKNNT